jgi:hypothetical protein
MYDIAETYEKDEMDSDPNDSENISNIRHKALSALQLFEIQQEIKQYKKNMIEQAMWQAMPVIAWFFSFLFFYVLFIIYVFIYHLLN